MNFSAKVRGGRGVLNISQSDFAAECGISGAVLSKIESGANITDKSQAKIVRAFENHRVFFTAKGIELDDSPVVLLRDSTPERCYLRLLEDVHGVLQHRKSPELLISYADDKVSPQSVVDKYREIRKTGVRMRQLISSDNTYIMGELNEYRCIPSESFTNRVSVIYGNNVAVVTAQENVITIFRDAVNAERERDTFNLLWGLFPAPERTTADERY